MRRSSAPTLQDVADQAGVTSMVASVVLNGAKSSTRVSDTTRERILAAAERLNYRRNAVALGLSRRQMDAIGVVSVIDVSPELDRDDLNLYFLELLNGILESAAECRQNVTVFTIQDWEKDEQRVIEFCDGRIDGLILIAPNMSSSLASQLPRLTPVVTIHSNDPVPHTHNLDVDNEEAAYLVVRHLIDQGHTRIMHITGGADITGAKRRLNGYLRALSSAQIPPEKELIVEGTYSIWCGREKMREWIESGRDLPPAIFCANDAIAYGCMEVLSAAGIPVPGRISIVGFDDTLMARTTSPAVTTIRQPFRDMGRRAVELLLEQIRNDTTIKADGSAFAVSAPAYPVTEELPVELVVRSSVGPAPKYSE